MFDSKFTFESHIRSVSSSIAQKLGMLRKSFKILGDMSVLINSFNAFILPCFEYCSPAWFSAADSHLKLLDRNLNAFKFSIPNLMTNLWHRRSISCLCMLFKIYHNPRHPLHLELPDLFQPVRVTRNAVNSHSCCFSVVRCNTVQYSRSFIPVSTKGSHTPADLIACDQQIWNARDEICRSTRH